MAARTKAPEMFVAISSGIVKIDGKPESYHAGRTIVAAGHPLLKAVPDRFRPFEPARGVEQATAAPSAPRGA